MTPLYSCSPEIPLPEWMSDSLTLYDSYWAVIAIHVGFQTGFCVFVLANYMRTIPKEILRGGDRRRRGRVAPVLADHPAAVPAGPGGAGHAGVHLDLQRLPLGPGLHVQPRQTPGHLALNNLSGQFFTDYNLLAAGSVLVALPTILVFLLLQKHFIAGLTLGSSKG